MALVVPNNSEVTMLQRLLGYTTANNQVLRLYTNDLTPTESTNYTDITQSSASGYAAITLTTASWTVSTSAGTTTGVYAEQTFTFSATETLYGYYVTDSTSPTPNLLWVERFTGAPFILPSTGGQVAITPTVNLE